MFSPPGSMVGSKSSGSLTEAGLSSSMHASRTGALAFYLSVVRHELNLLYSTDRTCYSYASTLHQFLVQSPMLLCLEDAKMWNVMAVCYFFFCRFYGRDSHVASGLRVGLRG